MDADTGAVFAYGDGDGGGVEGQPYTKRKGDEKLKQEDSSGSVSFLLLSGSVVLGILCVDKCGEKRGMKRD